MKDKGKYSVSLMKEFASLAFCSTPPNESNINMQVIDRAFEPKDSYGGYRGNKKSSYNSGGYDKRNRDSKYSKTGGYDKKRNQDSGRGGFVRKELTEDEKRMKDEAAQTKQKMEERNSKHNEIELSVKMIMNKITPNNYSSCKKSIIGIMKEHKYSESVLKIIGHSIFNKACVEKKYTQMYSKLANEINKEEAKYLAESELAKPEEQRIEEAKIDFEIKQQKAKEEVEKGIRREIPKDLKEFKLKLITNKTKLVTQIKKKCTIRSSIHDNCKSHLEKMSQEFEVDKEDPDWEEKLAKHREKVIGNVRFIGYLFKEDFMTIKLVMSIFENYLTKHPKELVDSQQQLTNVANDLVEACCILCEAIGQEAERIL